MSQIPSNTNTPPRPRDTAAMKYEPAAPEAPRASQPKPQERRSWVRPILITVMVVLVLGIGLGLGLGLGLKGDDDDDGLTMARQCIRDTEELHEKSFELENFVNENLRMEEWMSCDQTGSNSMTCRLDLASDVEEQYADLCEDDAIGGQAFVIDNAKMRCTLSIEGFGELSVTMHIVHMVECFAPICDTTDDEAFEASALTYIAKQVAAESEELKDCQYIPTDDWRLRRQLLYETI